MSRRRFISFAGAIGVAPRLAYSQVKRKPARVGIFSTPASDADLQGPEPVWRNAAAFLQGMRVLGYVYGADFVTVARGGENRIERYAAIANELAAADLDVIVSGGPALVALKAATSRVPIVMTGSIDPVAQGFVLSLAKPQTNFTGMTLQLAETTAKRLELLKELVPGTAPVAIVFDQLSALSLQAAQAGARARGWKTLPIEVRAGDDIGVIVKAAVEARAGAVLVLASASLQRRAEQLTRALAQARLPAMYELLDYANAGGLAAYAVDLQSNWRRAAIFVDKILKGANPGAMPVEQPTRFEFVLNLKAANALGISVPHATLLRADRVIE